MAARPSLEELLRGVAPGKLDQPCRDDHLSEIALSLTDWQSMAPFLGLTEVDEEEITSRYPNQLLAQKIAMLRKWRQNLGEGATYRELTKVFYQLGKLGLVEQACCSLNSSSETTVSSYQHKKPTDSLKTTNIKYANSPNVFHRLWRKIRRTKFGHGDQFQSTHSEPPTHTSQDTLLSLYADYLRGRYQTQIPSFLTLQWPPPPTRRVFNLAMIQGHNIRYGPIDEDMVRLLLQGRVNDVLYQKTPVKLEDIFKTDIAGRKVVLIEGAPGSGKSTLAWYICQQWQSGRLFQDFQAVVFVQLRDPAIQSARLVEDILLAENRSQAVRVVAELQARRGRDILWVMDGWDELPSCLRTNSVFRKLVASPETQSLHFSTVIITSRPIASGDLHRIITSRVEIVGFTPTEVKGYFTEAVGGDSQTVQKLQDQLRERPVIEASCYLPLNAAIVTHLFLAQNHSLPTTLHGVFTSLVLCCLIRHATKEGKEFGDISSLDNLPPCLQAPLENICALAYHGVMESKLTFSTGELDSLRLSGELATLGLIQGVESLASFKKSVSFNFLHLSVQELLASFYISKLPQSEQVKVFKTLFGQPRFAAVFQFYAAFTRLEAEGIREIITSIVKKKDKPQLLHLLNGLYEAQDLSLCQFVGSQLGGELDLRNTTLSPVDCLSVGYFISCICLTTSGEFKVNLCSCSLDDYRVSLLVQELSKCCSSSRTHKTTATDDGVPGCVYLILWDNSIHGNGTCCIAELISHSTVISKLRLWHDKIQEGEDGLYHLSQALRTNTSLVRLGLGECGITAEGVEVLSHALSVNKRLKTLEISRNKFGDRGLASLCNNLKAACHLESLSIQNCGITEKGVKVLADTLLAPVNGSLEKLKVGENAISDAGVACIAKALEQNNTWKLLEVVKCGITEKGAKCLADCLRSNKCLESLNLRGNHIADAGIVAITELLKQSSSFKSLDVPGCGITEKGAESLADCLMVNQSLEFLNLHRNQISDTGVALIANALPHNHTLKNLRLSKCGLTDQGMGPLARALEVNTSLETLGLGWDQFTDTGLVVLGESLKKNRGLETLKLLHLDEVTDEALRQFVLSLQENYCLTKLEVSQIGGGSEVVQDEAEVVNQRRRQRGIMELTIIDM